jgi:FMN phosphatase YigB (HAD superfamily)
MDAFSRSHPKLEAIIFDWGNTLVDYPLASATAQIAFLRESLLPALTNVVQPDGPIDVGSQRLEAFNSERSDYAVVEFFTRLRTLVPEISRDQSQKVEELICQVLFARATPCEGYNEAIEKLRRSGLQVAIISNLPWGTSDKFWRKEIRRHLGLASQDIPFVCCRDVGYRKPHSAPFARCIEILDCSADRTLMVGDNYHSDIVGAMQYGLPGALICSEHRADISDGAQYRSLKELMHSVLEV